MNNYQEPPIKLWHVLVPAIIVYAWGIIALAKMDSEPCQKVLAGEAVDRDSICIEVKQ